MITFSEKKDSESVRERKVKHSLRVVKSHQEFTARYSSPNGFLRVGASSGCSGCLPVDHFFGGSTDFSCGRPPSSMSKSGSRTVLPCSPTKAGWALIHSLGFCCLA